MREQIIKKINSSDSLLRFTEEELEYILQDYIHQHTKCKITESILFTSAYDEIFGDIEIDRKSIVNY